MEQDMERQARSFQDTKLKMLHQLLDAKGKAKVADGNLVFGDHIVNNNYEVVDKLKDIAGGNATIFMGDVRVSTNVMKEDGTRAIGSTLQGAARDVVLGKGVSYHGEADILGVPHFASYDPILDAKGSPIGIIYVGVKKQEFKQSLRTSFMIAIGAASACLVVFTGIIVVAIGGVMKEIVRLTGVAEQISTGAELDQPIVSNRTDELKELALSIERLRKSMKTALERLG